MTLCLTDFAGVWQVERRIEDQFSGQSGHFRGSASFEKAGAGQLTYHEDGEMRFGDGPVMRAERQYHWWFEEGQVRVTFADGGPFHQFSLSKDGASATHFCDPDDYNVRYGFSDWPIWRAVWAVTGPRKNYVSTTEYRRT